MSELPIKRSDNFGQLIGALAAAQQNFGPLVKTHVNTYTGKKYADLADVIAATQPSLSKNSISVVQIPIRKDDAQEAGVLTVLAHSSGEWISVELILPATMKAKDGVTKFDQQSIGSAITYARRYTWQALVGVAAEEDDDGNAATDQSDPRQTPPPAKTVKAPAVNTAKASTGGERPSSHSEQPRKHPDQLKTDAVPRAVIPQSDAPVQPPTPQTPATQEGDLPFSAVTPAQNSVFPTEPPPQPEPDLSEKPSKSQFDTFVAKVRDEILPALEKVGLKPSQNFTVGAKLKSYILTGFGNPGAKNLTDLTTKQWQTFVQQYDTTDAASFAALVEKGNA